MKIDKYILMGLLFISLSLIIFFTDILTPYIRPFTHLILMGSSKGKDILLFSIFGLLLILSQLFEYNMKFKENKTSKKIKGNNFFKKFLSNNISKIFCLENNTYLKIGLAISIATAIFSIILEVAMRYQMGISPFSTFVSLNPNVTTTGILHSHIYKSVVGTIISNALSSFSILVPTGIHTGDSLFKYVPELANIIVVILPLLFLTQLASLKNRLGPSRLFLTLTITVGLIGIFDGGLFSVPFIGGIFGTLLIYYDEDNFNYYVAKLIRNNTILNKCKEKKKIIKNAAFFSYGTLKRLIPYLFLISIILVAISVGIIGSNPEHYELNIKNNTISENQLNDGLNSYSILFIQNKDNNTLIYISPEYDEVKLLNSLINSLEGKTESFSMTWNVFSYINPNTTDLKQPTH